MFLFASFLAAHREKKLTAQGQKKEARLCFLLQGELLILVSRID